MAKKRKGCQNCEDGKILRDLTGWAELGHEKFPEVICLIEGGWSRLHEFGDCCDKHRWRNSTTPQLEKPGT